MEIGDDAVKKVREPLSIPQADIQDEKLGVDSGLSSIEKSKSVAPDAVASMAVPILAAPANMESMSFAVASVDGKGRPITETVMSFVLKGEEIKTDMWKAYAENLREIEEYVRQLLSSPLYIQLQEIRMRGDPQSSSVSGVQGAASATAAAKDEPVSYLSSLDKLQVLERVPASAEVVDPSAPQDSSQVLVLPLAAAMLIGGGLAIGTGAVSATNPLGGIVELVQQLQPIFPQVAIQDIIPMINLMVVAPIYFNSWNEAISNLRSGERRNYVQTAQNFAKDVIKIVSDPTFVKNTILSYMRGTAQLSPQDQDRLAQMLKIVLIGVSLSLLYSVEVGKVQGGKFGGIEPEELRELILGTWSQPTDPKKKLNLQEELTASLIKRIHEQLKPLSIKDREFAANMLLEYITKPRELDPMLDPAKVFDETLSSTLFNPNEKINLFKG